MPEDVRARAFDRYFTTKVASGSGIGLFAVKDFARRNGGDTWIRSIPGEGSTVTVALPCGTKEWRRGSAARRNAP
ncbi:sensor histidine kinase [Roseomonas sp. KE2513]|nr:sensor histidine kinase [Roseomonas sp. KE2513]